MSFAFLASDLYELETLLFPKFLSTRQNGVQNNNNNNSFIQQQNYSKKNVCPLQVAYLLFEEGTRQLC